MNIASIRIFSTVDIWIIQRGCIIWLMKITEAHIWVESEKNGHLKGSKSNNIFTKLKVFSKYQSSVLFPQ